MEGFRPAPPMIGFPPDLTEVRVLKTVLKKREIVTAVESALPLCDRRSFAITFATGRTLMTSAASEPDRFRRHGGVRSKTNSSG
jgi:hypothetical protein